MFDAHEFFKKRFSGHLKELGRYTRYMFNGHIAFAMFFFIAAFAFYYQSWLETIPDDFPTSIIMGVVFGLLLSYRDWKSVVEGYSVVVGGRGLRRDIMQQW